MDDLTGLSWISSSSSKPPPPTQQTSQTPLNFRPTPLSSRTVSPANAGTKPPPAGDSFSNLVSFGRSKASNNNMTLQERQKQLQEQKAKEEEERRKKMDALFGDAQGEGANAGFWNSLETGRASPMPENKMDDDEDDILAAFNAAAPVDSSSYYPPPIGSGVATPLQAVDPTPIVRIDSTGPVMGFGGKIIDPFDLDSLPSRDPSPFKPQRSSTNTFDDDDDILGDLAKPIEELPPRPSAKMEGPSLPQPANDPRDPAIAEIVDMGFTIAQAKKALAETDTGLDVTAAVGWLLEDAHRKSRPSSTKPSGSRNGSQIRHAESADPPRRRREEAGQPAWMKDGMSEAQEKDIGQRASEIGGTLFKSANSLWNTGRKKVGKAISELQDGNATDGGDTGMPKWMRDVQHHQRESASGPGHDGEKWDRGRFADEDMRPSRPTQKAGTPEPALTEEALMLEVGGGPPPRRRQEREKPSRVLSEKDQIQSQRQKAFEAAIRQKEQELRERERPRQTPSSASIPHSVDRRSRLTKEAVEEFSAVQYVSKNRRRPPPSTSSANSKPATPEPPQGDLLFGGAPPKEQSRNPFLQPQQQQRQPPSHAPHRPTPSAAAPIVTRLSPTRPDIPVSPQALQASSASRQKGTESFKRGDYPSALTHYTTSLNLLPPQHPIRIILLSNRALCNLKIGETRAALSDCDAALSIIGPGNGEHESITLEDGTRRAMKELFGKTLVRKAESYENMEKWSDALDIWMRAVEAGAGGALAISGKRRCENALRPKPKPAPRSKSTATAARRASGVEAARVTALRQANAAADRVEEEKLALHDVVEERVNAWKAGKQGNLRALLASLDTVLWEGNGWRKVGMGELLMPGKCKMAYMRGIAKVHPDKISLDATTEQKMISAAVFTLLNEAWDKFKTENRL